MKIIIKKDEYLFSEQGTHIIDSNGFAIRAQEDVEVEVAEEHYDRVLMLVEASRPKVEEAVPETAEETVEEAVPETVPETAEET